MKKILLVAALALASSTAFAQGKISKVEAVTIKQSGSPRDAFRGKLVSSLKPENKPKVDGIIAILIGLMTAEKAEPFNTAFEREAKKVFPKADAAQLDALSDLVILTLHTQLQQQLAEKQVRQGIISALVRCKTDNACIEKNTSAINRELVEKVRKEFENKAKELEASDRMGNFEIQRLMSAYNQAETLSSSTIAKKQADTQASVISKI